MNQVQLIGRLTRDPELRYTTDGTPVGDFGLAVDRPLKDDEADFFEIVVWRKLAETVANYLTKGRKVAVSGRLAQDRWEKDGQKRSMVKVVAHGVEFLDAPKGEEGGQEGEGNAPKAEPVPPPDDDDVPF